MRNWKFIVKCGDVADNPELSFNEQRDEIVKRLRAEVTVGHIDPVEFEQFEELVTDLGNAVDMHDFDHALEDLYDWADVDKRLWLQMF